MDQQIPGQNNFRGQGWCHRAENHAPQQQTDVRQLVGDCLTNLPSSITSPPTDLTPLRLDPADRTKILSSPFGQSSDFKLSTRSQALPFDLTNSGDRRLVNLNALGATVSPLSQFPSSQVKAAERAHFSGQQAQRQLQLYGIPSDPLPMSASTGHSARQDVFSEEEVKFMVSNDASSRQEFLGRKSGKILSHIIEETEGQSIEEHVEDPNNLSHLPLGNGSPFRMASRDEKLIRFRIENSRFGSGGRNELKTVPMRPQTVLHTPPEQSMMKPSSDMMSPNYSQPFHVQGAEAREVQLNPYELPESPVKEAMGHRPNPFTNQGFQMAQTFEGDFSNAAFSPGIANKSNSSMQPLNATGIRQLNNLTDKSGVSDVPDEFGSTPRPKKQSSQYQEIADRRIQDHALRDQEVRDKILGKQEGANLLKKGTGSQVMGSFKGSFKGSPRSSLAYGELSAHEKAVKEFEKRQSLYEVQRKAKLEKVKNQVRKQEAKECKFQPNMSRTSSKRSASNARSSSRGGSKTKRRSLNKFLKDQKHFVKKKEKNRQVLADQLLAKEALEAQKASFKMKQSKKTTRSIFGGVSHEVENPVKLSPGGSPEEARVYNIQLKNNQGMLTYRSGSSSENCPQVDSSDERSSPSTLKKNMNEIVKITTSSGQGSQLLSIVSHSRDPRATEGSHHHRPQPSMQTQRAASILSTSKMGSSIATAYKEAEHNFRVASQTHLASKPQSKEVATTYFKTKPQRLTRVDTSPTKYSQRQPSISIEPVPASKGSTLKKPRGKSTQSQACSKGSRKMSSRQLKEHLKRVLTSPTIAREKRIDRMKEAQEAEEKQRMKKRPIKKSEAILRDKFLREFEGILYSMSQPLGIRVQNQITKATYERILAAQGCVHSASVNLDQLQGADVLTYKEMSRQRDLVDYLWKLLLNIKKAKQSLQKVGTEGSQSNSLAKPSDAVTSNESSPVKQYRSGSGERFAKQVLEAIEIDDLKLFLMGIFSVSGSTRLGKERPASRAQGNFPQISEFRLPEDIPASEADSGLEVGWISSDGKLNLSPEDLELLRARFSNFLITRQTLRAEYQAKKKKAEKSRSPYAFKPDTQASGLSLQMAFGKHIADMVHSTEKPRLYEDRREFLRELQVKKEILDQQEVESCTFQPNLKQSRKSQLPDSAAYLAGINLDLVEYEGKITRFDSLFMHSAKRQQHRQQAMSAKREKEEEEVMKHPFKPATSKKSPGLGRRHTSLGRLLFSRPQAEEQNSNEFKSMMETEGSEKRTGKHRPVKSMQSKYLEPTDSPYERASHVSKKSKVSHSSVEDRTLNSMVNDISRRFVFRQETAYIQDCLEKGRFPRLLQQGEESPKTTSQSRQQLTVSRLSKPKEYEEPPRLQPTRPQVSGRKKGFKSSISSRSDKSKKGILKHKVKLPLWMGASEASPSSADAGFTQNLDSEQRMVSIQTTKDRKEPMFTEESSFPLQTEPREEQAVSPKGLKPSQFSPQRQQQNPKEIMKLFRKEKPSMRALEKALGLPTPAATTRAPVTAAPNRSPPRHPQKKDAVSERGSSLGSRSRGRQYLGQVEISMGKGKKEMISLHRKDNAHKVASDFCKKHSLPTHFEPILASKIQSKMNSLLALQKTTKSKSPAETLSNNTMPMDNLSTDAKLPEGTEETPAQVQEEEASPKPEKLPGEEAPCKLEQLQLLKKGQKLKHIPRAASLEESKETSREQTIPEETLEQVLEPAYEPVHHDLENEPGLEPAHKQVLEPAAQAKTPIVDQPLSKPLRINQPREQMLPEQLPRDQPQELVNEYHPQTYRSPREDDIGDEEHQRLPDIQINLSRALTKMQESMTADTPVESSRNSQATTRKTRSMRINSKR